MLSSFVVGGHSSELTFGNRRSPVLRALSTALALVYLWHCVPSRAFAKAPKAPRPVSVLERIGATQTPDATLQKKIEAREKAEARAKDAARPKVLVLADKLLKNIKGGQTFLPANAPKQPIVQTPTGAPASGGSNGSGSGTSLRNSYFAGTLPWHKSFRDVNLSTGNLFKSFTDIQVAPGKGAGLALQRTYNSNDNHIGAFGIGWTHAYDIRIEDAGMDADGTEYSPRTDFFGGKHSYTRDADGLYTPPPYLFDELDSNYHAFLSGNFAGVDEDKQVGQDGTVKHFISEGVYAAGHAKVGFSVPTRVCDYIEDRHGNRTNLAYTNVTLPGGVPKKLLATVTDPTGRQLSFTWANLGSVAAPAYRITAVQGPQYSVSYGYNGEYNVASVTLDPSGLNRTTTYGYTSVSDGNGNTETGLLSSITDNMGNTISYTYWFYQYDTYGNIIGATPTGTVWVGTVTEPAGETASGVARTQTYKINPSLSGSGFYVTVFDPNSSTGLHSMCFVDNKLRISMLWGGYYTENRGAYGYTYDSSNNVISEGSNGSTATQSAQPYVTDIVINRTFGPHGNVLTQTTVNGYGANVGTTTTEYFDSSKYFQKKKITDSAGRVTQFDYYPKAKNTATPNDPLTKGRDGQAMWVRDPGYSVSGSTSYGKQFEYDYNSFGQKVWEKNLASIITTFEYADTWGNLTKVRQDPTGLNRTTQMSYDAVGKVMASTDPLGRACTFGYNSLGQPTSVSFPAWNGTPAETITYNYGTNGRTNSITDGRGTTSMVYEAACDRVKSVTDPQTGTISYTYAPSGERLTMTAPNAEVTTYAYDNYTLLPSPEPDKMMRSLRTITDAQGRKVTVYYLGDITQGGAVYGPNILGLLDNLRFNQSFDTNGNLLSYCENKMLYSAAIPRSLGTTTTKFYWRTNASSPWQNKIVGQNAYGYNALTGQKTTNAITDSYGAIRTETYNYDELSRLTGVAYGDGQTQGYSFDSMGNRLAKTDSVTGNETYTYNNANMLLTRNGQGYTNDAAGNTLSGGGRTMTWDAQNRMVSCVKGGVINQFSYGSDGLRRYCLATYAAGEQTETKYVLDGTHVIQEIVRHRTSASASWDSPSTVGYMTGGSGPVYRKVGTASPDVRWYAYDGGGNVLGEVDVLGNVTGSRKHDVYGLTRGVSGTITSKHGWQGGVGHQSEDETGLIYMRARYYAPEIGRFQSQDPAAHGFNWFIYCNNDPINLSDETGKNPIVWAILAAALIGGIMECIANGATLNNFLIGAVLAAITAAASIFGGAIGGGIAGALTSGLDALFRGSSLEDAALSGLIGALFGALGGFVTAPSKGAGGAAKSIAGRAAQAMAEHDAIIFILVGVDTGAVGGAASIAVSTRR